MKLPRIPALLATLFLLPGCAGVALERGDCESMLPVERDRCLSANASNRKIVDERVKAERAAGKSSGEFDKDDLDSRRDQ